MTQKVRRDQTCAVPGGRDAKSHPTALDVRRHDDRQRIWFQMNPYLAYACVRSRPETQGQGLRRYGQKECITRKTDQLLLMD
jgi:hypothetical protein